MVAGDELVALEDVAPVADVFVVHGRPVMAGAWIEVRPTSAGEPRYRVRYRTGGRGTPAKYGGTFKNRELAAAREKAILLDLAELKRRKGQQTAKQRRVEDLYTDARRLSQQVSLARDSASRAQGRQLREAEQLMGQVTDLLFEAWRKSRL